MSCVKLNTGQDGMCKTYSKRLWQQVVLINKADVLEHNILLPKDDMLGYDCRYRIAFRLNEDTSGFKYASTEKMRVVTSEFSKNLREGFPEYTHSLTLPIYGSTEEAKCVLNQLDNGDYFGAVRYYDGTVEIIGFDNGLTTDDYTFNVLNSGLSVITLRSNAPEDNMPYIYYNSNGTESQDFDNNFVDVPEFLLGDFNDDFNDDFNNQD